MKHLWHVAVGLLILNHPVEAQFAAPGGLPPGFPHVMLDVLGTRPAFSASASIQVYNGGQTPTTVGCRMAMASGSLWMDVDTFLSVSNASPLAAQQLRQMHSITILRPDINRAYLVYPTFKSYVEMTYAGGSGNAAVNAPKIAKTDVAKETAVDHPCQKSQWSISEADGQHYDATVWSATDFGNFPMQMKFGSPSALLTFQNINVDPPNTALFNPPSGYIKYEGIQELLEKSATNGITP